jgi:hypothetical protein
MMIFYVILVLIRKSLSLFLSLFRKKYDGFTSQSSCPAAPARPAYNKHVRKGEKKKIKRV